MGQICYDLRGDDLFRAALPDVSLSQRGDARGIRGVQDAQVVGNLPARRCEGETKTTLH